MNDIPYAYRVFFQPSGNHLNEAAISRALSQLPDLAELEIALRYLTVRFITTEQSTLRVQQLLESEGIRVVSVHSSSPGKRK